MSYSQYVLHGHPFLLREYIRDFLAIKGTPMSTPNGRLVNLILTLAHIKILSRYPDAWPSVRTLHPKSYTLWDLPELSFVLGRT